MKGIYECQKNKAYYAVTIFLFAAFVAALPCEASGYRGYNRVRACIANLRTIEGAVELYLMENHTAVDGVEMLVKSGYLKSAPQCPGNSQKYIFEKPIDNSNFNNFYNLVKCSVHGEFLKDQDMFAQQKLCVQQYARERRLFFGSLTLLIALWTLLELSVLIKTQFRLRRPIPDNAAAGRTADGEDKRENASEGGGN